MHLVKPKINFLSCKPTIRCRSPGSFTSAWLELIIIACDVRGRGILQTDRETNRMTEGQTSQPGYILCLSPLQARTQKTRQKVTVPAPVWTEGQRLG